MTGPVTAVGFTAHAPEGDLHGLARQLEALHALGTEVVELNAVSLDAVAACRLLPERVRAVRGVLQDFPLRYTVHAPIPIDLMDEAHQDLHRRAAMVSLDLAAALGAGVVVLHPGRAHPRIWARHADRLLDVELEEVRRLGDHAQAQGVRIAYENISPNPDVIAGLETSYSLDPRALAAQLDRLRHPAVMACLDVSHAQQGAVFMGFDLIAACRALAPWTNHVHFSDSTGVPRTMRGRGGNQEAHFFGLGDMHAAPGWGVVDFDALADALAIRPDTAIVIEVKPNVRGHASEATLEAARRFAGRLRRHDA